ncbi:Mimitin, mitochondrial [Eufriesea mexicana]|uniref:Mimitin, mitochondrial n=1 Tax=Eufriesea mexicana TaxID=516756 RepID=A0A310SCN5_9HYME|nr:PREDICTED: mimitin, mitochondrial [Eufriesea mexicana]XP_017765104.1 PREDICTED: mimitin, mitochondrial [Eufriesea mexicana]OAD52043.1 Mimitin, mitochondrial [Eufriesea mexicana]
MSREGRGVIRMILKNFIASFKLYKHEFIGEDYNGTKYYEIQNKNSSRRNPSRYFQPVNKNDHTQEIPVEWEAWLRHRRKYPPSAEEIQKNYELKMLTKQNAAQIKATFEDSESKESKLHIEKDGYRSFPIYDEYKNNDQDHKK